MKIKQFLIVATAAGCLFGSAEAQKFATVTQGERGKCYVLTGAQGFRGGYLSNDGMFMGGSGAGDWSVNVGYVYDIARDTLKVTTSADVIKSWTVYAGNNTIQRDGQAIEIESPYPDPTNEENAHVSVFAASASLDTLVTMAYELMEDPTGNLPDGLAVNLPYLVDGKTGKILRRIEPHWPLTAASALGFGARVDGASDDATVLAGHSTRPDGSQWAPVFWDVTEGTSFFVGTEDNDYGYLSCTNNDGTLIGGIARGSGVIVHYDRAGQTYTVETIPYAPGKDGALVQGITETGLVLCVQSSGFDVSNREAYIYDMNAKTLTSLTEYVRELYGLELPVETFTAFTISDNGRKITGWSFSGGIDVPYLIELDENQIFSKPRSVRAMQTADGMKVNVMWAAPLRGQYTLKGYNIYCDSVKINGELVDRDATDFVHAAAEAGIHDYAVQAVYGEGESGYSDPVNILVIAGDGCLPVQQIGHHLTYNRHAEIYWGLPSARMAQASSPLVLRDRPLELMSGGEAGGHAVVNAAKAYKNERLDLIECKDFGSYYWSSALLVDNRLYAGSYQNGVLAVFNPENMNLLETFEIDGVPSIWDMIYKDGKFYLATEEEKIVEVDARTMTVSNELPTEGTAIRHITYIPTLNEGKGGFACGDWESLQYRDLRGRLLTTGVPQIDIEGLLISGTAYHDGHLYLFSQAGSPQKAEIYTVNMETGAYVDKQNLGDIQRLAELEPEYGFISGGLTLNTLTDGTVALAAVLQLSIANSHLAFLEVESAENMAGYNLYRSRNGGVAERVNPEGVYIQGLSYKEDLMEPGEYVYTVEAVREDGCTNMLPTVKTTVRVDTIGECAAPVRFSAVEHAKAVRLDWEYEGAGNGPAFIGFNVYRDEDLLAERLQDLKYTDFNVAKGNYTYRVEAFYDNSCVAADTAEIQVTHEGVAMPPAHLSLEAVEANQDNRYDVTATWDLPYFETPLALGYCNTPYNGMAMEGRVPVYALIAWDAERLAPYRDLYVVGIEYFIGEGIATVDGLVYMNDTLAYQKPTDDRIRENEWNTLMFDRYFSMDQPEELLVGYKVMYVDESLPVAVFDLGPAETRYGNWISGDGKTWATLKEVADIDANWCINALVVDKRDIEQVEALSYASAGSVGTSNPFVKVMRLGDNLRLTAPRPVSAAKSSSESVKLQGFNIYRENQKLNETLLQGFSYRDSDVEEGFYEYEVSAVYGDGQEVRGDGEMIDLGRVDNMPQTLAEVVKAFPNPAPGRFRVQGEYAMLEIIDLAGTVVARYADNRCEIEVPELPAGLYVLRFTLSDGSQRWQKVIME